MNLLLDLFIHSSVHMLGTYRVSGTVLVAGTQQGTSQPVVSSLSGGSYPYLIGE